MKKEEDPPVNYFTNRICDKNCSYYEDVLFGKEQKKCWYNFIINPEVENLEEIFHGKICKHPEIFIYSKPYSIIELISLVG